MYNLSHSYIYEYKDEKLINKSIEFLIKSSNLGFRPSLELLCIIQLKKVYNKQANIKRKTLVNVKSEISEFTKETKELKSSIINIIEKQQLYNRSTFEYFLKKYEEIEFIYDLNVKPICIRDLYNGENKLQFEDSNEKYKISSEFDEGFGYDIYRKQ